MHSGAAAPATAPEHQQQQVISAICHRCMTCLLLPCVAAGATGGVGKRVVQQLLARGLAILVRLRPRICLVYFVCVVLQVPPGVWVSAWCSSCWLRAAWCGRWCGTWTRPSSCWWVVQWSCCVGAAVVCGAVGVGVLLRAGTGS